MEIPVTPEVLQWAREFRGLSLNEAAERLGVSINELQAYEAGIRKPGLTKFEKFGSAYRLPLSTLFRRTPPTTPPKPTDFRTIGGLLHEESLEFNVATSRVRALQEILRTLSAEDEDFPKILLRNYDVKANPFDQGAAEREAIGVKIATQLNWKTGDGFRHWRAIIECLGIPVYLQKFPSNDCLGFSIWDFADAPPAIIVNKTDRTENAWVFTLIHEYAHLLIRQPGISDHNPDNPVEAFCNRFAASFLMPLAALKAVLPDWPETPVVWDMTVIYAAASKMKVSAQALAIRLEELNRAPSGFNKIFVSHSPKQKKKDPAKQKGDYIATRLSELGGFYATSVIAALDRDVLDRVRVSEVLGLGIQHLDTIRAYINRQRDLASVG